LERQKTLEKERENKSLKRLEAIDSQNQNRIDLESEFVKKTEDESDMSIDSCTSSEANFDPNENLDGRLTDISLKNV